MKIKYEVFVDATLRHRIDNKEALDAAIKSGMITQCPSNREADDYFLDYFRRHPENTIIISNDNFKQYKEGNLVTSKFTIMFDEIELAFPRGLLRNRH